MKEKVKFAVSKFENNVDFIPEYVEGIYRIPLIKPEKYVETTWIPFHKAGYQQYNREEYGLHFYAYDYQFTNLWTQREKYKTLLPQFKAVMSPDFSLYIDWPLMVQMWNHYRKHLLATWMQSIGCTVYPVIRWTDESSYEWCFDGDPMGGTVCVSSVGFMKDKKLKNMFIDGYIAMMDILKPSTIIFYGEIPQQCTGNIVPIEPFYKQFRR